MSFIDALTEALTPSLRRSDCQRIRYPETNWPKVVDAEIRLREMALKEKELEVRRLEALAKLETARKENRNE